MTADAALDPRPAVLRVLADLDACPPPDEEQMAWAVGVNARSEVMRMDERILASPRYTRHPDCQPLYDGPLCPLCYAEVDVIGVDTVIQGGGTEPTATGLLCPCGWGFTFNPPAAAQAPAAAVSGG